MKLGWTLSLLALILSGIACNWSDVAPPAAPVIEPSPLPTFAIPTLTPTPTETPFPTPTSTPDKPVAWPKTLGANCRYGPGQEWEVVNTIPSEMITEIKGRVIDTSWWYVRDPMQTVNESYCWVAYDVVDTAGKLNIVPIVEPPVASVKNVTVDTAVVTFTACGGSNQVMLNGIIAVNGPTSITYHWELSGAAQDTRPDVTLEILESGTQNVTTTIPLTECGEYIATLRVTEPNEVFDQKSFNIRSP